MKRWLGLVLAFVPLWVWADNIPIGLNLTPPATDLSYLYLGDIFGIVDGVLHGTGSQIIGTMFGVFNAAVLALGSIIVMYTLMVGTLNTAHQGEVLGQKWSSMWTPIKTVAGVGLMLPKASGYSYIQIFVMWVIVQGIGAADSVWNAALGYIQRGGVVVQSNAQTTLQANKSLGYSLVGSILRSEACMFSVQNALENMSANSAPPIGGFQVPSFSNTLQVQFSPLPTPSNPNPAKRQIMFPGSVVVNGTDYEQVCGSFIWTPTNDAGQAAVGNAANYSSLASDTRSIAVQQVMLDMIPIAQQIANWIIPPPNFSNQPVTQNSILVTDLTTSYQGQVVGGVADYMGIMGPYLNNAGKSAAASVEALFQYAQQVGWALAGSYYYLLVSLNNANTQTETTAFSNTLDENSFSGGALNNISSQYLTTMNGKINANALTKCPPPSTASSPVNTYICNEYTTLSGGGGSATTVNFGLSSTKVGGGKIGSMLSSSVLGSMSSTSSGLKNLLSSQSQSSGISSDPLVQIGKFGNELLDIAIGLWVGAVGTLFTVAMVASTGMCANPAGNAVNSVLLWFVPMLTVIIGMLFTTGAMMAYYVPLIPFLIYLFSVIGWLAATAEAMVAAPLVALGIAIPEGHEVMGKAEPAIMLIVSVFMRPTLIVFGFLLGSIIAHVALWLLNQGFGLAIKLDQGVIGNSLSLFAYLAMIVVYTGTVISIVNRSFTMIYEVPNKVLTWIGGTAQSFGEGQGVEEVKGQMTQFAEGLSKTGQAGVSSAHDVAKAGIERGAKKGDKSPGSNEQAEASDQDPTAAG